MKQWEKLPFGHVGYNICWLLKPRPQVYWRSVVRYRRPPAPKRPTYWYLISLDLSSRFQPERARCSPARNFQFDVSQAHCDSRLKGDQADRAGQLHLHFRFAFFPSKEKIIRLYQSYTFARIPFLSTDCLLLVWLLSPNPLKPDCQRRVESSQNSIFSVGVAPSSGQVLSRHRSPSMEERRVAERRFKERRREKRVDDNAATIFSNGQHSQLSINNSIPPRLPPPPT